MIDAKGNEYNVVDYEKYRKIQLIELEMLKELARICKKYNLKFYLCGGTLLGGVRHEGFIPWDDDLDVYLPREDYDRFAKIVDSELDSRMFYQDWFKEKGYPYNFAKIRMNGTKFVQNELIQCNMHHGIFIDIFPLDNVPDDKTEREKHLKKVTKLKTLLSISYMSLKKGGSLRSIPECIAIILVKAFFSQQGIHKKLENEILKYNEIDCANFAQKTGMNAIKEVYPKAWFKNTEYVDFEKTKMPSPSCINEYLTYFYGDYMTPPPSNEWGQTHPIKELDFGTFFDN